MYLLLGPDEGGEAASKRIYVGEADVLRSRLDSHLREKEFWTRAFVLVARDGSLNKAHARYLEARLIHQVQKAGRATLENSVIHQPRGLREADEAEMEAYLDDALLLLPLIGVDFLDELDELAPLREQRTKSRAVGAAPLSVRGSDDGSGHYFYRENGVDAEAVDDARGFIVLKGALARRGAGAMTSSYRRLRDELIKSGVMIEHGADQFRFTRNHPFSAPSAAASVLVAGSRNGRLVWRDEAGRTLDEREKLETAAPRLTVPLRWGASAKGD